MDPNFCWGGVGRDKQGRTLRINSWGGTSRPISCGLSESWMIKRQDTHWNGVATNVHGTKRLNNDRTELRPTLLLVGGGCYAMTAYRLIPDSLRSIHIIVCSVYSKQTMPDYTSWNAQYHLLLNGFGTTTTSGFCDEECLVPAQLKCKYIPTWDWVCHPQKDTLWEHQTWCQLQEASVWDHMPSSSACAEIHVLCTGTKR